MTTVSNKRNKTKLTDRGKARTYDRDVVATLLEALGDVRTDEAGASADADLGTLSGGQREGFVVRHGFLFVDVGYR